MQTSLGGAISFCFWFSSWSRNGNKLVSVKAANKTEGEQNGASCRAGCACPPGDKQSHSPVRMVARHWHSTLFSLKTGSGVGSEVLPVLCVLPLWCWGGESQRKHHHPLHSQMITPVGTAGSRKGSGVQGGGCGGSC